MSARPFSHLLGLVSGLLLAAVPGAAWAADYDPFDGYGNHSLRLGLSGDLVSGTLPATGGATYVQKTFMAEFNAMAFSDPTVFGTLLGVDFDVALGARVVDRPAGVTGAEDAIDGVKFAARIDFEFTYDLVRWKIHALRQRLILTAGGGADYNAHPWQLLNGGESGWRAYPLLGLHVQSSIGSRLMLDVVYRLVATQSKDDVGAEHRVEVALVIKPVVLGVHFHTLSLLKDPSGPLAQNQLGAFVAWGF